jgi:hypothetical protein
MDDTLKSILLATFLIGFAFFPGWLFRLSPPATNKKAVKKE